MKVKGFGTLIFDPNKDRLEEGKGGFVDLDLSTMSTAQRKTVRLKRATKSDIYTMSKGDTA